MLIRCRLSTSLWVAACCLHSATWVHFCGTKAASQQCLNNPPFTLSFHILSLFFCYIAKGNLAVPTYQLQALRSAVDNSSDSDCRKRLMARISFISAQIELNGCFVSSNMSVVEWNPVAMHQCLLFSQTVKERPGFLVWKVQWKARIWRESSITQLSTDLSEIWRRTVKESFIRTHAWARSELAMVVEKWQPAGTAANLHLLSRNAQQAISKVCVSIHPTILLL